jgi:hypothetical protein
VTRAGQAVFAQWKGLNATAWSWTSAPNDATIVPFPVPRRYVLSAIGPVRPSRSERPLFVAGALLAALVIFAGFARTFYLKGLFGTPPLSSLLMVHGVVMTLWIVLFVTQITLVANGRTRLHRGLGLVGGCIAVLIFLMGVAAAIDAGRRGFTPTVQITPLMFMAIPIVDVVVFGTLVGTALLVRRHAATHKRLMLLATLGIVTPGAARLPFEFIRQGGLPAFFGVMIAGVCAVVAIDTVRNRRLHPAFGWGAAFLIASVPLRIALAQTTAWQQFAAWLIR